MHVKILLVVAIFIMGAFFFFHAQNPGTISVVITKAHTYTVPLILLVFLSFFAGVVVATINTLIADARRAYRDYQTKKKKKLLERADECVRKGTEELLRGNTESARASLRKALELRPEDPGIAASLSETYIYENKPKEALKVLEEGLKASPGSPAILMAIGRYSLESGDAARAAKAFQELLALGRDNIFAARKLRDIRVSQERWQEAGELQKKVIEGEKDEVPREKEKRFLSGLLFEASKEAAGKGNFSGALSMIREILKSDNSFTPAHLLLGEVAYLRSNISNAIKVWEKAQARYPKATSLLLRLEDAYVEDSLPEKMIELYRKLVVESQPDNISFRVLLARFYSRLEMVDAAIGDLEKLHNEGHDSAYTGLLLGAAYLRRGQARSAAEIFQKILDPGKELSPPFLCTKCHYKQKGWAARCPSCGRWNTLDMNLGSL